MYLYKTSTQLLYNTARSPVSRGRGRCHRRDATACRALQGRRVPGEVSAGGSACAHHWGVPAPVCVPSKSRGTISTSSRQGGGTAVAARAAGLGGTGSFIQTRRSLRVPEHSQPGAGSQSQTDQTVESASLLLSSLHIILQPSPAQNPKSFTPVRLQYLSLSEDTSGEP